MPIDATVIPSRVNVDNKTIVTESGKIQISPEYQVKAKDFATLWLRNLMLQTAQQHSSGDMCIGDVFTDSTGLYNTLTIVKGSFNTDHAEPNLSSETTFNPSGSPTTVWCGTVLRHGIKIHTHNTIMITTLNWHSNSGTKAYILDENKNVLQTVDIVSGTSTHNFILEADKDYYFATDSEGAHQCYQNYSHSFPQTGTDFDYIAGLIDGNDCDNAYRSITGVHYKVVNDELEVTTSKLTTTSSEIDKVLVVLEQTGTSNLTIQFSPDNGTTWQTISENTITDVTSSGTEPKIKITGYNNLYAYVVMLWLK